MRATAILMIEYEVETLHPSDPAVAAMNRHANAVLTVVAHQVSEDGVAVGNVYAFTTGLPASADPT